MAEPYLTALRAMLARLPKPDGVICKHFFAGAGAYADGRLFMTYTPVGYGLKLPPHDRAELLDRGAQPLRYFPNAPVKKDYVLLPPDSIHDDELKFWIGKSIAYVSG